MSKPRALWLRWRLPYIAIAGLGFALVTVLGRAEPPPKAPPVTPPAGAFARNVAGIGVIEPKSELIAIGVELPGVVRRVAVKVGDSVRKGQLLFALDQRDTDAQIAVLEKSLASAKVQAADAAAQFATVQHLKDARALARDEINKRKYARDLAVSRVAEIEAQLAAERTTKARQNILAPIDGDILEVNVRPGEYASAGALATPLMRMGDNSTLHVRVEIDEENAAQIRTENKAEGSLRGDPNTRIPLQFVRFEPYVKPKQNLAVAGQRVDTRVLQIIYALPADAEHSFVGQQMDVFIDAGDAS